MKAITKLFLAIIVAGTTFTASALEINDPGVVGAYAGAYVPGHEAADVAQHILDMAKSTTEAPWPSAGGYQTSDTEYSGVLGAPSVIEGVPTASQLAGYEYALAKYDGPNGGAVLFHLPTLGGPVPTVSNPLWGKTGTGQYGLSNVRLFNATTSVPDGGATAVLLGLGFLGLAAFARKRS